MTKWKWYIPFSCLVLLHSPDGSELRVESHSIVVVRPLQPSHETHVARGTKSIIIADGQKFAVTETPEDIDTILRECK